jgi:NTP pyrophosphatase (non-canonical NTP hydrolase)
MEDFEQQSIIDIQQKIESAECMDGFVEKAIRTEKKIEEVSINLTFFNHIKKKLKLLGDILDSFKKNIFYNRKIEKFDSFFKESVKTSVKINPRIFHATLGVVTESFELMDALGNLNNEIDLVNMDEEYADILWYIAIYCDERGITFKDLQNLVINKLKKRFPDKFEDELANNRNLEEERKIIEEYSNK